jgi:hypothetical protein
VIEGLGLVALVAGLLVGAVDVPFMLLFLVVAYGYGVVLNLLSLALDEVSFGRYRRMTDRPLLILWSLLENLGYRQLTVAWRLRGMWRYLRRRTDWGAMTRRGFSVPSEGP